MFCGSVSAGYGSVEGVSAHIGGRGNSDMASRRLLFNLRGACERWFTPAALPRHGLRANRSYSTTFIQPKKRRSLNEEVPIYIHCPCHGAQPVRRRRRPYGKGSCYHGSYNNRYSSSRCCINSSSNRKHSNTNFCVAEYRSRWRV